MNPGGTSEARRIAREHEAATRRLRGADLAIETHLGRQQLELLTAEVGLDREIRSPEASSRGLVLAGYTARFAGTARVHILGETEITYLASLDGQGRSKAIHTYL